MSFFFYFIFFLALTFGIYNALKLPLLCSWNATLISTGKCMEIVASSLMKPLHDLIHVLKCFAVLRSYVPALRPLRQQAFLLSFPQTQPSRLTQRLSEVSARRELKHERGHLADQHQRKFIVCRSHCGRAWRPTPARWCVCVRRRTTTSGRASTHCRWSAETRLSLPPFSFTMLRLHHAVFPCVFLYSSFMDEAWSGWTSRPSSVCQWDRRTRTKACSTCGRRSSSYREQNGKRVSGAKRWFHQTDG